jgi:hypothetical protein
VAARLPARYAGDHKGFQPVARLKNWMVLWPRG